jgi:hypothetical protein
MDRCRTELNGAELTAEDKTAWNGAIRNITVAQRTRGGITLSLPDLHLTEYGGQAQQAGNDAAQNVGMVEIADAVMSSPQHEMQGLQNLFSFAYPKFKASDISSVADAANQATAPQAAAR